MLAVAAMHKLMDAALDGSSWEELKEMHAKLTRDGLTRSGVENATTFEGVCRQIETSERQDEPANSLDSEGRYMATDEDIPF